MPPIALDRMSTVEKLQLMEAIWDDLRRADDDLTSPDWHGQVLADRDARAASGESTTHGWDEAKKRIRDAST